MEQSHLVAVLARAKVRTRRQILADQSSTVISKSLGRARAESYNESREHASTPSIISYTKTAILKAPPERNARLDLGAAGLRALGAPQGICLMRWSIQPGKRVGMAISDILHTIAKLPSQGLHILPIKGVTAEYRPPDH
jgi:hypothetical protein